MTNERLQKLVETAIAKALTPVTITRGDGSTFVGCQGHQTADDGDIQVYVVPVQQRTRAMKPHFRITYYRKVDGQFRRVSRERLSGVRS